MIANEDGGSRLMHMIIYQPECEDTGKLEALFKFLLLGLLVLKPWKAKSEKA